MSEQPEVRIELEHLKRVHLEPGDILVVQVPLDLSEEHAARLKGSLSRAFPGHEIGILTGGGQLGVVRPVPDGGGAVEDTPET